MELAGVQQPAWPPLAWVAALRPGEDTIRCHVGPRVEHDDRFLVEGAWPGDFSAAEIDRTDLFFGSGLRVRGSEVTVVSSSATLDRIHTIVVDGTHYVSNSMICLLSTVGGRFSPQQRDYGARFRSILGGINAYEPDIPTTAGTVRIVYVDNLTWTGDRFVSTPKPDVRRDFSTFDGYRSFLADTAAALVANARDPRRQHPLEPLTTMSRGYDSTTVTVIAEEAGCRRAFGFDRARQGIADDGGESAALLGLDYDLVDVDAWRSIPLSTVPFLSAVASAGSSVSFKGAEALVRGALVFTGYHGDPMWNTNVRDRGPDLVRTDLSGSDLTEYRLWAGFVNCPLPFWGARQQVEIQALNESDDLQPWNVEGGYSRPLCRRIGEEAGIPREAFGQRKAATAQMLLSEDGFLTEADAADYRAWLEGEGLAPGSADETLDRSHVFHWAVDRALLRYDADAASG